MSGIRLQSAMCKHLIFGYIRDCLTVLRLSYALPEGIIDIIVKLFSLPPIVLDEGSQFTKIGYAGTQRPDCVVPSVVGVPRHRGVMVGMVSKDFYVADEAVSRRGILSLRYPIEHGVVTRWPEMVQMWRHCLENELRLPTEDAQILCTEKVWNPKANREKAVQIMFEELGVAQYFVAIDAVMALYALNKTSGVVVDSGSHTTNVVPVCDGKVSSSAVRRLAIGGEDCTEYLCKIMTERGYCFQSYRRTEIEDDMKHKLCFVAVDFDKEMIKLQDEERYELPDGQFITIGNERFRTTEIMFKPEWIGMLKTGIHELIESAIAAVHVDDTKHDMLWKNIVLCGGNASFAGMQQRLQKELETLKKENKEIVNVMETDDVQNLCWTGASMYATFVNSNDLWIDQSDYEQYGGSIVHRKCNMLDIM